MLSCLHVCFLPDTVFGPHMRRDFYRGSQDSLADRMEEHRSVGTSLFRGELWTDVLYTGLLELCYIC